MKPAIVNNDGYIVLPNDYETPLHNDTPRVNLTERTLYADGRQINTNTEDNQITDEDLLLVFKYISQLSPVISEMHNCIKTIAKNYKALHNHVDKLTEAFNALYQSYHAPIAEISVIKVKELTEIASLLFAKHNQPIGD